MFLLKKLLALCFYPLPLGLAILILGLFCLWGTRRQRLGKALVTLGTLLLLLFGFPFLSVELLASLEGRYPALLHPETISWETGQAEPSPRWIVVLGGGHVSDPRLPPNSQINPAALGRVVEGVRLYKAVPGSKLLLSGGGGFDPVPEAEVMAQVAVLLGVKPDDMVLEPYSRDTANEAEIIANMVGREKIILVTSAFHMPRSMALFKKRGLQPIPAPTSYLVQKVQGPQILSFIPSPGNLELMATALHEYLGLVWAWLRRAI
jgi:uncharacterized SAM-binding protein YcdF (DUF218 family)